MYFVMAIFSFVVVLVNMEELQKKLQSTMCGSEIYNKKTDCYYLTPQKDLPVLIDKIRLPEDCIFFIETSCRGGLNYRQACAIESAVRAHPEKLIIILFIGPVERLCLKISPLSDILAFKNVKVFRIHLEQFLKNTPLQSFLATGVFHQSHVPVHHASDILRFVTLFKYGGIYMDMDVIVVKSIEGLPESKNWIAKQSKELLGTAFMGASKEGIGHEIVTEVTKRINTDFRPKVSKANSNDILAKVLQKICGTKRMSGMTQKACHGFKLYSPSLFYPVPLKKAKLYFAPQIGHVSTKPYAYHFWNFLTHNLTIYNDSLYSYLIETHCPKISRLMH